jgi:transposase InsO family protein
VDGLLCHGPALVIGGKPQALRIHGMLDDASRFVVALEAMHTEREVDMPGLLSRSVRRHELPDAMYLDNGSTYSGATLRSLPRVRSPATASPLRHFQGSDFRLESGPALPHDNAHVRRR